jgi:hypothetical protein
MQIKSILLGLGLLGASSAAIASPYDGRPYDRDRADSARRYDDRWRPGDTERLHETWMPLAPSIHHRRGTEVVDVWSRDRFNSLRLQNQAGETYVRAIIVEYANGERQRVAVNRALEGHRTRVDVQLPGGARRIARVVVIGESSADAAYQLYAM